MAIETEGVKFVITTVDDSTRQLNGMAARFRSFSTGVKSHLTGLNSAFRSLGSWVLSLGNRLKWLAAAGFGAVTVGAAAMARGIVGATVQAQTLRARLNTLYGADAGTAWEWATKTAAQTPFELQDVIDQMALMKAMGMDAYSAFAPIADAASAMGGGAQMMDRITRALGQMQAKTKVSAEEMMQLTESGIPAWQILSDKMGLTVAQLMKMGELGKLSAAQALPALLAGMQSRFGGGMAAQMETLAGKWSNFKDAVWRFFVGIGDKIAPVLGRVITGLTALVDKFAASNIGERIGNWIGKAFSLENMQRVADFFRKIYEWGKSAFDWLAEHAGGAIRFIRNMFAGLLNFLRGPFLTVIRAVAAAMIGWKTSMVILSTMETFLSIAANLAKIPGAGPGLAAGAIGTGMAVSTILGSVGTVAGITVDAALRKIGQKLSLGSQLPKLDQGKDLTDAFMAGFSGQSLLDKVVNVLQGVKTDTGALVQQGADALSQIYGGGPRAKFLSSRFAFGGAGSHVTVKIEGGDAVSKGVAEQTARALLVGMQVPHTVRANV